MANVAQPKQLVLTHAYPQLDRTTLPQVMQAAGWKGKTIIARDGLQLEVELG